jgi:hypothetical protein
MLLQWGAQHKRRQRHLLTYRLDMPSPPLGGTVVYSDFAVDDVVYGGNNVDAIVDDVYATAATTTASSTTL